MTTEGVKLIPQSDDRTELMEKLNEICQGHPMEVIGACLGDMLCFMFSMHNSYLQANEAAEMFADNLINNVKNQYDKLGDARATFQRVPS